MTDSNDFPSATSSADSGSSPVKRSRFRFSLRTFGIALTIVSVLFGVWAVYIEPINRQWRAAEQILEEGKVGFEITKTEPAHLPSWLLFFLSENRKQNIVGIAMTADGEIDLKDLKYLRELKLTSNNFFSPLPSFPPIGSGSVDAESFDAFDTQMRNIALLPNLESVELFCSLANEWRAAQYFNPEVDLTVFTDAISVRSGEFPLVMDLLAKDAFAPRTLEFEGSNKYGALYIDVEEATDKDLRQLNKILTSDKAYFADRARWRISLSLDTKHVSSDSLKPLFAWSRQSTSGRRQTLSIFPSGYRFKPSIRYDSFIGGINRFNILRDFAIAPLDEETLKIYLTTLSDVEKIHISNGEDGCFRIFNKRNSEGPTVCVDFGSFEEEDWLELPVINGVSSVAIEGMLHKKLLRFLTKMPALTDLSLVSGQPFEMADARMIGRCKFLSDLRIDGSHVTSDAEIPLNFLKPMVEGCALQKLNLRFARISKEHLEPLKECESLTQLDVASETVKFHWWAGRRGRTLVEELQKLVPIKQ